MTSIVSSKPILSFLGLGYVGLTYAVAFACKDFKVLGYDVDQEKAKDIATGRLPIYEPELDKLLHKSLQRRSFRIMNDPMRAVLESDITFITVGTPESADGSVNLKYIIDASRLIGEAIKHKKGWHLIVVKSTVPPGTTEKVVAKTIMETSTKRVGEDFGLCVNPEFLREGNAVKDVFNPDRIIIGAYDKKSGDYLEEVFRQFYDKNLPPIVKTNLVNAEIIKYANNAFLAMKISFINMIANLCEKIPGADVSVVAEGIGLDRRIGVDFLRAGLGFGGSCLPKDLKALQAYSKELEVELPLVEATLKINELQPLKAIQMLTDLLGNLNGRRVAVLGLAFKSNTDDMRNAVSIKIIDELLAKGAKVVVYDPAALKNAKKIFGNTIEYADSALECLRGAEAALIVTEWDEFKKLKPEDFKKVMKKPIIIDGRRIYDANEFRKIVTYKAIGLGQRSSNRGL